MNRQRRMGGLVTLVALAHAAVFWVLATQPRTPPSPSPIIQIALVDPGGVDPLPAGLRARPSTPSARDPETIKPGPPAPEPPQVPDPSLSASTPLKPASPPSGEAAPPDLTWEPVEVDPGALAALAQRLATARRPTLNTRESACGVTDRLQRGLTGTPAVQAVLARVPLDERSVANAVVIWSDRWTSSDLLGGDAVAQPIRQVLTEQIALVSAACRNLVLRGPRLLVLPTTGGPTVLAVGSGEWRWSDLLR